KLSGMTAEAGSSVAAGGRVRKALGLARRMPFTLGFTIVFLLIGVFSGSLWSPAADKPWYADVATGLPAFADGRWWTVFTSPFVVTPPYAYLTLLPLLVGGLGWAEWRFGSL